VNQSDVLTPTVLAQHAKYSKNEVYQETLKYFGGDELATSTFITKYALRNPKASENNFCELTPADMHKRLASEIAMKDVHFFYGKELKFTDLNEQQLSVYESRYNKYYDSFDHFKYIVPQGSPMYGTGNPFVRVSLSNCVVVQSPKDMVSGIMDTGKDLANLFKRRAGVGLDLSTLRPENSVVSNSAGTSTGAWSFADYYSNVCRMIGQNGRRGALMETLNVLHPDIDRFVTMKHDRSKVTGANVSIMLTDEFMQAVEAKTEWITKWPCETCEELELVECDVQDVLNKGGKWVEVTAEQSGTVAYQMWYSNDSSERRVLKKFNANELWMLINSSACATAEPGIIFWDNYTSNLPAHCYPQFKTICVNPCVPKDAWTTTQDGPRLVNDLINKQFNAIVNGTSYSSTEDGFFATGYKEVFEVRTKEGFMLPATSNHPVLVSRKQGRKAPELVWREVGELIPGDKIVLHQHLNFEWDGEGTFEEGWLLGNLIVDGNIEKDGTANLDYWGTNQKDLLAKAVSLLHKTVGGRSDMAGHTNDVFSRVSSKNLGKFAEKYGVMNQSKTFNELVEKSSSDFTRGFIRGWMDADGSVEGTQEKGVSIRLASTNLEGLEIVQRMLARLGIISTIYKNRRLEGYYSLPDGNGGTSSYWCHTIHSLCIANDNIIRYNDKIGFTDEYKQSKLENIISEYKRTPNKESFLVEVEEIVSRGFEDVFDCTIPEISAFDCNGFYVHNCSEIGLSAYDSCRLTTLNLKNYVKNPFQDDAYFDFNLYREKVREGVRVMDNIVELEIEYLTNIIDNVNDEDEKRVFTKLREAAELGRRIGLGDHALADALTCLKIRYDSDEAIAFVDQVFEVFRNTAYDESVELAKERGAFPAFDWETEKDCEFIKRLPSWLQEKMAKYGRRNIAILTMAPTGSVSIESQTSSGLEPVFMYFYMRRKKINPSDPDARIDFVDQNGDKWEHYMVFHPTLKEYFELNTEANEKWQVIQNTKPNSEWSSELSAILPDYFVQAGDINGLRRVEIQGVIQKYIDHGISSTINLPMGTTPETVAELYYHSWKHGLKGVTVYVDGSRTGVLVSAESDNTDNIVDNHAPKRPEVLPCDIMHSNIDGQKWTILIGLHNGRPYEVFGGLSEHVELPKKYKTGTIIKRKTDKTANKNKANYYDLVIGDEDDEIKVKDISVAFNDGDYAWATRTISTMLRHGVPVSVIVDQLSKDKDSGLYSFGKVMARQLKKYVVDGTASGERCPECGEKLIFQEGCHVCLNCGNSKCS